MEGKILMALVIGPLIIPNLFIIIGSIGCVIGVKFMEIYLNYCKNHGIYIDPSGGIIYGIYGMILGFFGIYFFDNFICCYFCDLLISKNYKINQ